MELNSCKVKFKTLFEMFFKEGFELSNYFSENLLKYLEDRANNRENIVDTPFFSDLIINSLINIGVASRSVRLFIVETIYIMFRNELQFSKFANLEGFKMIGEKLFLWDKRRLPVISSPALQLAGVKMCSSIITHCTGLNWLIEIKIWERLMAPQYVHNSSHCDEEMCKFIAKLIWKLDYFNIEPALVDLLNFIISPIQNNPLITFTTDKEIPIINIEDEKPAYVTIATRVKILLMVVSDSEHILRKNSVVPLMVNYFMMEPALGIFMEIVRDPDFKYLIVQLSFRLSVAYTISIDDQKFDIPQKAVINYCNITAKLIEKRQFEIAIKFSATCVLFWAKLKQSTIPSTFERHERTYEVQNQFLIGVLAPIMMHSTNVYNCNNSFTDNLSIFCDKMAGLITEHAIKVSYLFKTNEDVMFNDKNTVIEATKYLYELIKHLTAIQAGIVYQTLFYILQSYVVTDDNGALTVGENPVKCPIDIKLFNLVLDLIKIILREHDIKWYDSIEIIGLQTCLMNIAKLNLLPKRQLLQALDLIDLTIKKFLSPDLALLTESRGGNTLNEIIVITRSLIEQPQWELRDSALHIVLSCTELAFIQYVPMQKLLQENHLMPVVAHTALFDDVTYVQSTALRCLAAATKMGCLWNLITQTYPNIHVRLVHLLNAKHDDIVRKDATNVLSEMYAQKNIPNTFTNCLHDVMTSAAIEDLYWEVQLKALNFWKIVLHNTLLYRGIVYDKFPSTTFCKERRKIITLSEPIIKQQIVKILNDLAEVGCLKVLNKCLKEDQHILVFEKAFNIAKSLLSITDLYKFDLVPETMLKIQVEEDDCPDINMIECDSLMDLTFKSFRQQQIIEEILNTSHNDLIQHLFDKRVQTEHDLSKDETVFTSVKKWLNPNDFIRDFRENDYLAIIEGRKNWNSGPKSLDALLDEVIALGEVKREVAEDCT